MARQHGRATAEEFILDTDENTYRAMLQEALQQNWAGGFCKMPDAVRNDRTLSPKAKIIYEQLLSYMWLHSDHCWPSQQTLADATGYSRRTVIRACKELYERGYIEKWRRGQGYTNYYFINPLTFPHSFRRTTRERVETMIVDVHAPQLRIDVSSSPPRSFDETLALCQTVTSRSDNVSHPEVTNWHPNQTKENQIHGKERSSKDSTAPQKGMDFPVVTQATRNEHEATRHTACKEQETYQSENRKNNKTVVSSKSNTSTASPSKQDAAGHAKDAMNDKFTQHQTKQAAIAAMIGIPEQHLEELEIAQDRRRPIPEFIRDIISRYSRELGDSTASTKSNITRAAKLYFFALDYIKDAQDDPQGFFSDLLYEAKQAAYKVNGIRYRGANNRPNRIPVFFTCLENRFELSEDELAYIRSDEPLSTPSW
jgi:biotin operon repressor